MRTTVLFVISLLFIVSCKKKPTTDFKKIIVGKWEWIRWSEMEEDWSKENDIVFTDGIKYMWIVEGRIDKFNYGEYVISKKGNEIKFRVSGKIDERDIYNISGDENLLKLKNKSGDRVKLVRIIKE